MKKCLQRSACSSSKVNALTRLAPVSALSCCFLLVFRLAGGEYRDPHFLQSFETQTFRDLSESCCTAMLMAPMKNNMPVWNSYSDLAQVSQHRRSVTLYLSSQDSHF